MKVSTDDRARNLRYPWKGPSSAPFGFEVRFNVLGIFLGITALAWALDGTLVWLLPLGVKIGALGVLVAPAAAVWPTRKVAPHLTPDTPFRYYTRIVKLELSTPRPPRRPR